MPLGRTSLAAPLDVKPKEVEPVAHVRDPGLGFRKPQPQLSQHIGDVFAQDFDVGLVAVHEHNEVVCLCGPADYADGGVTVLVDGGDRGRVVGIIPAL